MTTQPKIILVAGANGQLGQLMLTALQDRAARNGEALLVRALVRKGRSVPAPTPTLVYEAIDYTNPADLERVSEGAFAVVCCLLGVEDVIIGAQSGLLKAALGAGARRFIPSDFGQFHQASRRRAPQFRLASAVSPQRGALDRQRRGADGFYLDLSGRVYRAFGQRRGVFRLQKAAGALLWRGRFQDGVYHPHRHRRIHHRRGAGRCGGSKATLRASGQTEGTRCFCGSRCNRPMAAWPAQ